MKCSAYCFHIKTKILTDFQICISVPLNKLIRNRLPLLQSDPKMKMIFLEKSIKGIYKRGKNVTEILSPSSFPSTKNLIFGLIGNCNKRCDICTNFMVFDTTFNCTETGNYYKVKGTLSSNSVNVVYSITCQCCTVQYVGSAITFKERFCMHKSDIKQVKEDAAQLNILWNVALG